MPPTSGVREPAFLITAVLLCVLSTGTRLSQHVLLQLSANRWLRRLKGVDHGDLELDLRWMKMLDNQPRA